MEGNLCQHTTPTTCFKRRIQIARHSILTRFAMTYTCLGSVPYLVVETFSCRRRTRDNLRQTTRQQRCRNESQSRWPNDTVGGGNLHLQSAGFRRRCARSRQLERRRSDTVSNRARTAAVTGDVRELRLRARGTTTAFCTDAV